MRLRTGEPMILRKRKEIFKKLRYLDKIENVKLRNRQFIQGVIYKVQSKLNKTIQGFRSND